MSLLTHNHDHERSELLNNCMTGVHFNENRRLFEAVVAYSSLRGFADQSRKEVNYRAPLKNGFLEYKYRKITKVVF